MHAAFYHPDGFIGLLTIHNKIIHSGGFPVFDVAFYNKLYRTLDSLTFRIAFIWRRLNKEVKILIIFDLCSLYCFF